MRPGDDEHKAKQAALAEQVRQQRADARAQRKARGGKRKGMRLVLIERRMEKREKQIAGVERINAALANKRAMFDLDYAKTVLEARDGVLYWKQTRGSTAREGEVAGCRGQIKIWDYIYTISDVLYIFEHGVWPDNFRKVPPPYEPAQRTAWNKGHKFKTPHVKTEGELQEIADWKEGERLRLLQQNEGLL